MTVSNHALGKSWAKWNETGEGPSQCRGNTSSYIRNVFYSRDTPIAVFHQRPRMGGQDYVLACSNKYSPSTATQLRHALRWFTVPVFTVPFVGMVGGWSAERVMTNDEMLMKNAEFLYQQLGEVGQSCAKRWFGEDHPPYGETYWRETFHRSCEFTRRYMRVTEVAFFMPPDNELCEAIAEDRRRRREAWEAPSAVAMRARREARQMALRAFGLDANNGDHS